MKRLLIVMALVITGAVSLTAVKPAQAFIVLDQTDVALGQTVTFTTSYPQNLNDGFVFVQVICYVGPTRLLAYGQTDYPDRSFLLGGTNSYWLEVDKGPASCVADLFYWSKNGRYTVLASTDFEAAGL